VKIGEQLLSHEFLIHEYVKVISVEMNGICKRALRVISIFTRNRIAICDWVSAENWYNVSDCSSIRRRLSSCRVYFCLWNIGVIRSQGHRF